MSKRRLSEPVTTPPLDVKIPHPCAHCGRANELIVRVAGLVALHEPKQPSVQVVDGLVSRVIEAAR